MSEEQDQSDKTEDPSQRRLDEALRQGDVVKSQEVTTWFVIGAATLALSSFSGSMGSALTATMRGLVMHAHDLPTDGYGFRGLMQTLTLDVLGAVALPFLMLLLAAVGGNVVQHRFVWSTEGLMPKLSKVSPGAGFKRLFSKQALANFVKGMIKLAVVGGALAALLWPERHRLEAMVSTDADGILPLSRSLTLELLGTVTAILAFIAAADYLFQYRQWYQRQKMSLRELKDEYKESEGDPKLKAHIRQLRHSRMKKRMMAAVPSATVVITNPTHYAVALRYEHGMNAPLCVAKGIDAIALKIREVATKHEVPIVENPPLARTLHATVEVDREISAEHYKAVAEVISYVMKLRHGWR